MNFLKRLFSIRLSTSLKGEPRQEPKVIRPNIEWVDIPAGTFIMGSPESEAHRGYEIQHQVTLNAFKMSKYVVTFEQYKLFCEASYTRIAIEGFGGGKRPATFVSWYDANAFAEWMDCRLPTEAEWEYACRAETTTPFNTGNNLTTEQANYDGNYPYNNNVKGKYPYQTRTPLPVGSFAPNAWGLYEMHGNVNEWCIDWYDNNYPATAQTNPQGTGRGWGETFRVYRGGSVNSKLNFINFSQK